MNCEIARRLTETGDPALAQHVLSCPSCILRTHAPYYEAPLGLEQKIRQSLKQSATQESPVPKGPAPAHWRWVAIAAALLLVVSMAWNIALLRSRVDPGQLLADNVLSAHVRSLAATHLLDVPSSDHHTVKPWFDGKLNFAPDVKDVDGFPLLGGRLEYFDGHAAAALVYGRAKHIINLFTWPSPEPTVEARKTLNGYHMETWSSNGMTFWAVSDLNEAELSQFMSLYRRN